MVMRICLIAPPLLPIPPHGYGGTELVIDTLARGLVRAGHHVLLVATGDSSCPVERTSCYERAVGVGVGGSAVELRHVVHGYAAAERWRADLVHDHTIVGPLYGMQIATPPIVTTNHGPFTSPELGPFYRAIASNVPVIAISRHHAAGAESTPIGAVIHHGVDVGERPVGDGTGGYALFLGRLHPDKGVDIAARVARAAGVPLIIAAKMQEALEVTYFEREVQHLLDDQIRFVGEVGGAEKVRLLGRAMCLLNPIRWPEPFGLVMIEALAVGTPVVATPCGSAPELVDHGVTGYLAEDERQLATFVRRAGGLARAACRRAAEQRFSADRMVEQHVAMYESVLARHVSHAVA
jgi:glycosyltransferase involved in cell wall biosynthesis